jgi:hypothetical protein
MSKLNQITAGAGEMPPADKTKAAAKKPQTMLVLDMTAQPGNPPREHQQIVDGRVQTYKFEPGVPLPLAPAVAVKFLRHEAFQLVDKEGQIVPYQRRPKQPDELGAGEQFKLADNETIARYDELSNASLLHRALELPGGEKFGGMADAPKRTDLIDFIAKTIVERRKANTSSDREEGSYTPKATAEPDFEDEAA